MARGLLIIVSFPVIAACAAFALLMLLAFVVSGLPRVMQGEAVVVPWSVCAIGSIGISVLLPWLALLPIIRRSWQRIYFVACLALAVAACWSLFGLDELFSKAYRRGL